MNEHRRQILEMLAEGKINAQEAERLLSALGEDAASAAADNTAQRQPAKYIRVMVDTIDNWHGSGKSPTKVNIRVPMQLLRSGVRLAGLIPAAARVHVEDAMHRNGIDLDLSQIKPENLEEIVDHLQDVTIDVDDENTKVRVFAE